MITMSNTVAVCTGRRITVADFTVINDRSATPDSKTIKHTIVRAVVITGATPVHRGTAVWSPCTVCTRRVVAIADTAGIQMLTAFTEQDTIATHHWNNCRWLREFTATATVLWTDKSGEARRALKVAVVIHTARAVLVAAPARLQLGFRRCPLVKVEAQLNIHRRRVAHPSDGNAGVIVCGTLVRIYADLWTTRLVAHFALAVRSIELTQRYRVRPALAACHTVRAIELCGRGVLQTARVATTPVAGSGSAGNARGAL